MWNDFYPNAFNYVQHLLKSAGSFRSIVLVSKNEDGELRNYKYRTVFGESNLLVTVTVTKSGKISEMSLGNE